ncbi:hypothetical protein APR04_001905 [Promicromonospora umidemergens]|nr:hypothetical protein [Promicromonospora umidemergens]MCP2283002.1 hypothetical protein [Promicromonospora umidemergens]
MFRRSRPAVLGAAVAVALTLGLSGCQVDTEAAPEASVSQSASPTPTTPPSPSVSPTPENPAEAAKAKNVAEAKQRYVEFQNISSKYAKKGGNPFWDLIEGGYLGTTELRKEQQSFWEQYADQKLKETGDVSFEFVEVTRYEGDPRKKDVTGHRVHMRVCADNSNYDVVNPDGDSVLQKGGLDRVLMKVVMQGQKQDGIWSVNGNTSTGKKC